MNFNCLNLKISRKRTFSLFLFAFFLWFIYHPGCFAGEKKHNPDAKITTSAKKKAYQPEKKKEAPKTKRDRLQITPDLMQTDKRAALPFKGNAHCGPVSVAGAMIWLANRGYPELAPSRNPGIKEQSRLAIEIGNMMNTTRRKGTTVNGFLRGIESYLSSKNCKFASLKYQGWQRCEKKYHSGIKKPHPDWIFKSFDDSSCVFLKIGWYRYFPDKKEYVRFAGHFVNVVGLDRNSHRLIIHDPSPRSGVEKQSEKVSLIKLKEGKIVSGWVKPFSANAMYKLASQLKLKTGADLGILDGIIILKMK